MQSPSAEIDAAQHAAPLMVSASGLRGIVGTSLTPSVIVGYTHAVVYALRRDDNQPATLILARDGRASGPPFHAIVKATLQAAGVNVIDIDCATTPTAGVMVTHHNADGAIVLTASHNPQQWNGIKAIDSTGAALAPQHALALIDAYRKGVADHAPHHALGTVRTDDTATHVHVAKVLDFIEPICPVERIRAQSFNVVVDSVNASGARGAELLLDALGVRTIHLHNDDSGIFPHEPEPIAENLTELSGHVTRAGAAAGFAQDPDADRLAIVDDHGRYIGEEYTLALAAMAILQAHDEQTHNERAHHKAGTGKPPKLAANLSTSRMIDDIAARFGGTVLRTPVGEANVVKAIRDNHAVLGGEGNGGVIVPAVVDIRDSLTAMALVLALLTRTASTIYDLVEDMPAYAIVKRKSPAPAGLDPAALGRLRKAFPDADTNDSDGLRLDLDTPDGNGRGWVHVRASNTEPIVRVIAEAPTEAGANALADMADAAVAG